ncbi:MAG: transglutaminase domain-containing protein [Deltaproteobacteria bacterium]|nr:transglutaminase domain-containing protein [Deltaproteobacteria bacterium]
MRRTIFPLVLLLAATGGVADAGDLAKTRSGTVECRVDLSAQVRHQDVRLWLPYPTSDSDQVIRDVKVTGDFADSAVYTDRVHGTPMLYARWDKGAANRTLTLSFGVEREEVLRRDFPEKEAAWDPRDYALYLAPTSLGPTDGAVKQLADKITAGKTTVLEKAKAVYDWVCENTFRDPDTKGCGQGNVCKLLETPGGKCADLHSVFVSLTRAAGVPSREVFGLRLGKKPEEDVTGSQHCWAEFFLPGYGWVPVDAADVRKAMLTEKLTLSDARTGELRAYYWGGIDAYRVKLAMGRDLVLGPPQAGAPLNYLMYPYAEIGGKPVDWLEPKSFRYAITFRETP